MAKISGRSDNGSMFIFGKLRQLASDRVWFVPLISALVAGVAAYILGRITVSADSWLAQYLWPGDTAAAADMLSFIASSMLTVLTTVISMTLIVLQVASGQFSQQLLRDYIRSRAVKGIFSVFTAVFVYALILLRSVEAQGRELPPQIGVTVAMVLVLFALATFVWYVARVVSMVRVDSIIESVTRQVEQLYYRHRETWPTGEDAPQVPAHAKALRAEDAGYVRAIALERGARWAEENDAVVVVAVAPGDPVITGQVVAWVYGRTGKLAEEVKLPRHVVNIDCERAADADIRLGVHQLSDIAVRAMSPGTNDPTTAVHSVNQAISILRMIAEEPLANEIIHDDDGKLRAFAPAPRTVDFIYEIVGPVRRYSGQEPAVLIQLLRLLAVVEEGTQEDDVIEVVADERRRIVEAAAKEMPHPDDAAWVKRMAKVEAIRKNIRVHGPDKELVDSSQQDEQ